jgi:hypothetical protein
VLKRIGMVVKKMSRQSSVTYSSVVPAYNKIWDLLERKEHNVSYGVYCRALRQCIELRNANRLHRKNEAFWDQRDRDANSELESEDDQDDPATSDNESADEQCADGGETDSDEDMLGEVPAVDAESEATPLNLTILEAFGVMARLGIMLLRKHYNRAADASTYTMVLDPRYNIAYCRSSGWNEIIVPHVKPALDLIMSVYQDESSKTAEAAPQAPPAARTVANTSSRIVPGTSSRQRIQFYVDSDDDDFALQPASETADSELERYFKEPILHRESCPLAYWMQRRAQFPLLSQIALDHAAIPATSIAAEQLFSAMGRTCTPIRNRLKQKRIKQLTCIANWNKFLSE